MGGSLGYLIKEGFKNFFKNKRSTSISIITMICAMFLFGIFFTIGENINSILIQVQQKQGMEVFIFDFATQDQIDEMQEEIRKKKSPESKESGLFFRSLCNYYLAGASK